LVERIATSIWRQRRIYRIEPEILRAEHLDAEIMRLRDLADVYTSNTGASKGAGQESDLDRIAYENTASERLMVTMHKAESDVSLGRAFARSYARGDTLSKLSRYEAGIEGLFTRRAMSCCVCKSRGAGKVAWCCTQSMFRWA
jgi:hypothetical protein